MTTTLARTSCTVCGNSSLEHVLKTPSLPVFQGCIETPESSDISAPQEWAVCKHCGTVQMTSLMPLEIVYSGGHATSLGGIWDRHHTELAAFVKRHGQGPVLEVGGGVGKLAHYFRQGGGHEPWIILEPNPLPGDDEVEGLTYQRGLLDASFTMPENVGRVVFSHCLEHIYDLRGMVSLLAEKMPVGNSLVIAWPQIEKWLPQGLPGALNWEHTYYVPLPVLKSLLTSHGFRLVEHTEFGPDHSHFLAYVRDAQSSETLQCANPNETSAEVSRYWQTFQRRVDNLQAHLNSRPQDVWFTPASVYTQYLLAFGLNKAPNVRGILDNATVKQGKRLYGTSLKVFPQQEMGQTPCYVIINGGAHTEEMMRQLANRNPQANLLNAVEF